MDKPPYSRCRRFFMGRGLLIVKEVRIHHIVHDFHWKAGEPPEDLSSYFCADRHYKISTLIYLFVKPLHQRALGMEACGVFLQITRPVFCNEVFPAVSFL